MLVSQRMGSMWKGGRQVAMPLQSWAREALKEQKSRMAREK